MYPDIPFLLPKSYAKLVSERSAASSHIHTVDSQVRNKLVFLDNTLCRAHKSRLYDKTKLLVLKC